MPLTRRGKEVVVSAITNFVEFNGNLIIMHGDCPTGVDNYVGIEYREYAWPFPAKWKEYGKAAGMYRNSVMVRLAVGFKYSHEVQVLAFPSTSMGSGTQHCIREAKKANLNTRVFPLEPEVHHDLTK